MGNKTVKNKGFTLLEVILSMAILAMISIPLLNYFVDAAKYNILARKKQEATLLAQNVMEDLKNEESLNTIVEKYKKLPSWKDFSQPGKSVYYEYVLTKNMGGRTYDVKVDLQSEKLRMDGNPDVKMDMEPDIQLLDVANDVISTEKSLDRESAKLYFLSINEAACEEKYEQGFSALPLTEEMLASGLQRRMYLDFSIDTDAGGEYLNTKVTYDYWYNPALGGAAEGMASNKIYPCEVLNNRMPLDRKRKVFFFYHPSELDKVTVSGADFTKISALYFIAQKPKEIPSGLRVEGLYPRDASSIYTNANIVNMAGYQPIVAKKQAVRMVRMTVSIDDPKVILTSTKGE
ncbi:MAG: type II secretion system protein [Acetivibrio sp.]